MARGKATGRYTPKRSGGGDSGDDSSRWLGTYGDMITLLMAFFVMLYAISQVDQQKFEAFVQGLADPFGNPAGMLSSGSSLAEMNAASDLGDQFGDLGVELPDGMAVHSPASTPTPIPTPTPTPTPAATPTPADVETVVPAESTHGLTVEVVREHLSEALAGLGLRAEVAEVRREERGIVITIAGDDVLFASGATDINPLGRKVVAAIADIVDGYPNDIAVEGHTDNVPLNRGGYTNWNLSTDRAVAVLALLVERHGLEPQRLSAMGYGEYRPVVANDTKTNRAKNRRVDIIIFDTGDPADG